MSSAWAEGRRIIGELTDADIIYHIEAIDATGALRLLPGEDKRAALSRMIGVGKGKIVRALYLLNSGADQLIESVVNGESSITQAYNTLRLIRRIANTAASMLEQPEDKAFVPLGKDDILALHSVAEKWGCGRSGRSKPPYRFGVAKLGGGLGRAVCFEAKQMGISPEERIAQIVQHHYEG